MSQTADTPGWRAPSDFRNARVHMIGIGGSGMAGLAAILARRGARVTGSDQIESPNVTRLRSFGVQIGLEQTADRFPADAELVVASAAIDRAHAELVAARRIGIPILKYAQLLGALMSGGTGIAIAGTHGKSTTSAWLAFVLQSAGLDPSFVIGAEVKQLGGGSGVGDGKHFVAEACEYDRSFHNLKPVYAAILNIEEDHLDCFENLDAIRAAFEKFAAGVPANGLVLLNQHDINCRRVARCVDAVVETFGLEPGATWRGTELAIRDGRYELTVLHNEQPLGRAHLGLPGKHNVLNALAVCALAHRAGARWEAIADALAEFRGARRRLELRGEVGGVTIVDDYAHHPTEIRATLQAARERFEPRRLWCIFQPHQHSRTRFLLKDFARSFKLADEVIVPRIYFVRDSERERHAVSATDLVDLILAEDANASHIADFDEIVDTTARGAKPGDLVITMGAGDIWKVADELVQRLRTDHPA